ncbi:ABC transporter ATP-binding protein [Clostridium sp. PL3]|uniref:ABC transporter ATP-binding protein n=1 Tax=Clostridium thailandense TaxID=2794346 RepID=A0A949X1I1_9CLOT|nr:ABC transporter ATP-binding protein [Clostridium thailandense]MBV7272194.1 ABC transporter ATP-binding protein [Clostridium thailandense]
MIELMNISKSYNKGMKAVDNLNLTIKDGEIFGFLGHNGAGKTTTLKMITGILEPDEGDIKLNGVSIKKEPLKAKMELGYVPDNPDMFLRLKGIEYINFMADMYEVPSDLRNKKIENLSKRLELDNVLDDKIQSYSHGMRQKIVLMGALIHDPSIWILDEPMTGLDPKAAFTLKEMMKEHVSNGKTVFFSTHVLEVAEKICDKVAVINKGKILFSGTLDEMREHFKVNESLESMFLEITQNE